MESVEGCCVTAAKSMSCLSAEDDVCVGGGGDDWYSGRDLNPHGYYSIRPST